MNDPSLHTEVLELDCFSDEIFERAMRFFVRSRYGAIRPVRAGEMDTPRGHKPIGVKASDDLRRVQSALWHAQNQSAKAGISPHQRRLRQCEIDTLMQVKRYLLNAEAGEEYSEYDLELAASGPEVVIVARRSSRK